MAQETAYTSEDETALQQCVETVNDINSAGEEGESASLTECIGIASNTCQDAPDGASTQGIVACNQREQSWWDMQLNLYYDELKADLESDVFDSLQQAQRAWLTYRDAKCTFVYELWRDGSIRSVVQSSCMLDTTATRAIELGEALDRGN